MSEFHDPDLRQQLDHLSGPYPDDNAAFAAWQRRVGQVRRRRAVAWTTGAAMSLIVGIVGFAALQRPERHTLVPGQSSENSVEFSSTVPTTVARQPSTTEATTPVTTAPTTLAPDTAPSTAAPAESSLPEPAVAPAAGSGSTGTSTKPHDPPTSTTPDVSEPTTQTFTSDGGSITVRQSNGRLTVVETNPADGFRAKASNRSARRVEVTFKSWDHEFRITVRLSDGVMKDTVSDESDHNQGPAPHDSTPDNTAPDNTAPDNSSGGGQGGGGYGGYGGYGGNGGAGGSDNGGGSTGG
jgi:uncharacterized membrane protein YgcG